MVMLRSARSLTIRDITLVAPGFVSARSNRRAWRTRYSGLAKLSSSMLRSLVLR